MFGSILNFGRTGRAIACLVAVGIVSGFSAAGAKAKLVEYVPKLVSLDKPVSTPSNLHNPNLVYVNVSAGTVVHKIVHGKLEFFVQFDVTSSKPKQTPFTVYLKTKNSSSSGDEYAGISKGSITFNPLVQSVIVDIPIDFFPTTPKSFYLVTTGATENVQLGDGEGKGTIP